MKVLLFLSATLLMSVVQARSLVCALKEATNPKNDSSVQVDLSKLTEDYYIDEKGIAVGDDHFSFNMQVSLEGNTLSVSAVFFENKHVQDEVGSYGWDVDLSKAVAGQPVIQEPLTYTDDQEVARFVCYYNK